MATTAVTNRRSTSRIECRDLVTRSGCYGGVGHVGVDRRGTTVEQNRVGWVRAGEYGRAVAASVVGKCGVIDKA